MILRRTSSWFPAITSGGGRRNFRCRDLTAKGPAASKCRCQSIVPIGLGLGLHMSALFPLLAGGVEGGGGSVALDVV